MTDLEHQILTALDRIGPQVSVKRVANQVTATAHQSRIRCTLYEMQCAGLCVSDDALNWTITNAGRKLLEVVA